MTATEQASPSGVVTFLFTDIEGSTRRWESDADGMRAALAAHDEVLRGAVGAHGGFLFKHTGDGVCAVFTSPKSAVEAAIDAQRALELPVRMGISTGEAELRGTDYFGAVLNRAARVMAAGHGGQILLDGQTAGLLRGADLIDLGPRRLRDITQPVQVFQVRAEGLRTEFPPLATQDDRSGNLRVPTTSLIGREKDLGEVVAVLAAHRLVTLTGPGGVGKTRLALEVAVRVAGSFPEGVWLFELATVSDPVAVPDAVAAVLGITQQPGKTVSESVAAALEGRARLLVFDNCEHVLDAAAELIEMILSQSSTVRVLATSREGLGLPDEQVWPVSSLDQSDGIDSAAVTLFVERAQGVAPRFTLATAEEAKAVIDICRRLDGIPLAIELAASRMASMTPIEVHDRLDQRFRLLVGSRRGLGRHHTLRHAVAWSYDLLGDPEKALLNRCSVFAGGFDLAGACAVSGSDDEFASLDLLDALVRKSLLVVDRSSGRTRYSMLETIREFVEEQLVASGEAPAVRASHARYFAGRETDIMALWDSPRQGDAYDWFAAELANLRTAFRWAADQHDLDTAATIATDAGFIGLWLDQYEPLAWVEEAIAPARAVGHPRLAFLYALASAFHLAGRIEAAVRYTEEAQTVSGDGVPFGVHGLVGGVYQYIGEPQRYVQLCRDHVASGRDTHGFTTACLAFTLPIVGGGEEAMSLVEDLIQTATATRNPWALCWALFAYGLAFRHADPPRARDAVLRGLILAEESCNRNIGTHLAASLSRLEAESGDPLAALDFSERSVRSYHDAGNSETIPFPLAGLAILLERVGRYESAATIVGFASNPFTTAWVPELIATITRLREVLGDRRYELLARRGLAMTIAEMAAFTYDQIDQARAALAAVSAIEDIRASQNPVSVGLYALLAAAQTRHP